MPDFTPVPLPEETPWLQLPKENHLWYSRFMLYLQMGHVRTMRGALHLEDEQLGRPPTRSTSGSWQGYARKFRWIERANAYDEHRRLEVFTQGNAHDLERISKLDKIAEKLYDKTVKMLDSMKPSKGGFNELMILAQCHVSCHEAQSSKQERPTSSEKHRSSKGQGGTSPWKASCFWSKMKEFLRENSWSIEMVHFLLFSPVLLVATLRFMTACVTLGPLRK